MRRAYDHQNIINFCLEVVTTKKGNERKKFGGGHLSKNGLASTPLSDCLFHHPSSDLPQQPETSQRKEPMVFSYLLTWRFPIGCPRFSVLRGRGPLSARQTFSREAKGWAPPDLGGLHACMANDGWSKRERFCTGTQAFVFFFPFLLCMDLGFVINLKDLGVLLNSQIMPLYSKWVLDETAC